LRENNKFLHYEEIQQVLKSLLDDFLEGHKDSTAVEINTKLPPLTKAKQLQRFLTLLFYTSLPPSRALKIRTLQHDVSLQFRKSTNTWWLVLSEFKTVKHKGIDLVELNPVTQKVLVTYLELFLNKYRDYLLQHWWDKKKKQNPMLYQQQKNNESDYKQVDEKYLFVPPGKSKNQGYTESAWSSMMCNIFKEKTGMNISINCLRSSFITYFYDSDDSANLTLRESIAHGMRHSIVEAQKTYDKRTRQEKKRKGVDWCGNNTMKYLGEDFVPAPPTKVIKKRPTKDQSYNDSEPHSHIPSINDVVAVSFKNDADEPTFWLGKCLRVNTENNTLLLGWFQEIESNRYKMKIGASWEEVCIILLQYLKKKTTRN
jgi:hypothetical protein